MVIGANAVSGAMCQLGWRSKFPFRVRRLLAADAIFFWLSFNDVAFGHGPHLGWDEPVAAVTHPGP